MRHNDSFVFNALAMAPRPVCAKYWARPIKQRPMMENDIQTRSKRRGRLGRDVQSKLGKTLQAYFDDVVKEGVPDRFKDLLQQYDERKDKGSS